jgi:hypothetical protein
MKFEAPKTLAIVKTTDISLMVHGVDDQSGKTIELEKD